MATDPTTDLGAPGPAGGPPTGVDALLGRVLNNAYRVEAVIGTGGMGVVYKATQVTLGRAVAVKTILGPAAADEKAVARFFREARLLSQLSHPNVIHVIDFGTSDPGRVHFMVMEYLNGQSLDAYAAAALPLSGEAIHELMAQLCAGVGAAHAAGIVHRDLKPSNIFLTAVSGSVHPMVKVLDFGLAKAMVAGQSPSTVTRVGTMLGTPGYSSPEQIQGLPESDPRSDVYGLGAVLHFLVAGQAPYSGPTFQAVVARQLTQPPEPLDPARVGADRVAAFGPVVRKAMALDPAERYQTPAELLAAVDRACRGAGDTPSGRGAPTWVSTVIPASRVTPPGDRRSPTRRAAVLAGTGLAAALTAGVVWWKRPRPGGGDPAAAPLNPGATAPGVTADEISVGTSGPLSGPSAELGRGIRTGLELAFAQVNAAGGVFGRQVRLAALDDGYEPNRAAENVARLIDEYKVFAFAGNVGTPTAEKTLPVALAADRVFFAPYTGARFLRKTPPDDRRVFNFRAGYDEETAATVKYLRDDRGIGDDEIAVFSQEDAFGDAGFAGVEKALGKAKAAKLPHGRYPRNTTEIDAAVDAILAAKGRVKAVVMVATYRPAAAFIRRARDAGLNAVFTNVSFVGPTALAEALSSAGARYTENVVVSQVVPHPRSNGTAVVRYREALAKADPEAVPGFVSLEGYLAGLVLAEGLKAAGPALTTAKLVDALEGMKDLDIGIGAPVRFTLSDHQASHRVWGTRMTKDGKLDPLDELG